MEAFESAAAIATRFQATLVLLHVMEKVPEYVESHLRELMGKERLEEIIESNISGARREMAGKKSSNTMIQEALASFCSQAGIDDDACGYHSREIVVTEGDVVDGIIQGAIDYQCDLIVMGTREGFFSHNSIGPTIKGVMRQTRIPVMVVPPASQAE
jgi:nucleotide-binding universal stress UspA family protein